MDKIRLRGRLSLEEGLNTKSSFLFTMLHYIYKTVKLFISVKVFGSNNFIIIIVTTGLAGYIPGCSSTIAIYCRLPQLLSLHELFSLYRENSN